MKIPPPKQPAENQTQFDLSPKKKRNYCQHTKKNDLLCVGRLQSNGTGNTARRG